MTAADWKLIAVLALEVVTVFLVVAWAGSE